MESTRHAQVPIDVRVTTDIASTAGKGSGVGFIKQVLQPEADAVLAVCAEIPGAVQVQRYITTVFDAVAADHIINVADIQGGYPDLDGPCHRGIMQVDFDLR